MIWAAIIMVAPDEYSPAKPVRSCNLINCHIDVVYPINIIVIDIPNLSETALVYNRNNYLNIPKRSNDFSNKKVVI